MKNEEHLFCADQIKYPRNTMAKLMQGIFLCKIPFHTRTTVTANSSELFELFIYMLVI